MTYCQQSKIINYSYIIRHPPKTRFKIQIYTHLLLPSSQISVRDYINVHLLTQLEGVWIFPCAQLCSWPLHGLLYFILFIFLHKALQGTEEDSFLFFFSMAPILFGSRATLQKV